MSNNQLSTVEANVTMLLMVTKNSSNYKTLDVAQSLYNKIWSNTLSPIASKNCYLNTLQIKLITPGEFNSQQITVFGRTAGQQDGNVYLKNKKIFAFAVSSPYGSGKKNEFSLRIPFVPVTFESYFTNPTFGTHLYNVSKMLTNSLIPMGNQDLEFRVVFQTNSKSSFLTYYPAINAAPQGFISNSKNRNNIESSENSQSPSSSNLPKSTDANTGAQLPSPQNPALDEGGTQLPPS